MIVAIRKNNISKISLVVGIVMISLLLLLRDIAGITVPKYLFISLAAIVCFLGDITTIYCLIGFIAPLANGISYTFISIIALLCTLIKRQHSYRKSGLIAIGIILVLEFASAFRGGFSFGDYIRFASVFLLSFLFMIGDDENFDYRSIVRYYIIGYVIAMVDLIGQMLIAYSFSELMSLGIRIGNTRNLLEKGEGMLLSFDQNGLGAVCILATSFSILLYRETRSWEYLAVFGVSILVGITTLSRAYLLLIALQIIVLLFLSKMTARARFVVFFGLLTIWTILRKVMLNYVLAFIERFRVSDVTNGRIEITSYYFKEMVKHPDRLFIGVGMQDYQGKFNYIKSCHNAEQEILVTWGVVGLLAVIVLLINIVKNANKINPTATVLQYMPFVLLLIFKQFGQGFTDTASMLWMVIVYCAIAMRQNTEIEKKSYENNGIHTNI